MTLLALLATVYVGSAGSWLDYGAPSQPDVIAFRSGYVVGFNDETHCPEWTMHRLTAEKVVGSKTGRTEDFRHDPQVPRSAELEDYRGSGWSRGHMVPAADMKWSPKAMSESFLLSNIVPQDSKNNSGSWNRIEQTVRDWAMREKSLWVITGPVYDKTKPPRRIGATGVRVPDAVFKVVLDETPPRKMIAFLVDNRDTKASPQQLVTTVAAVEKATGLSFFDKLKEKKVLAGSDDVSAWGWTKTRSKAQEAVPESAAGGFVGGPVCDKWQDTGYWLNTNSNKRHNRNCPNYRKTRGYPCEKDEGRPCGICGG